MKYKTLLPVALGVLLFASFVRASPDVKAMTTEQLNSFVEAGATDGYRDAVKQLLQRGEGERIRKQLRDSKAPVPLAHYMMAQAVASLHPEGFSEDMAALLGDEEPGIRFFSLYYLFQEKSKTTYRERVAKLLFDPSKRVRLNALVFLRSAGATPYKKKIEQLLTDKDEDVRKTAKDALDALK